METNSFLHDEVKSHEERLEVDGVPQIDYTIRYDHIDN